MVQQILFSYAASDKSKHAVTSIIKLVNLAITGRLPFSVAAILCSAFLNASRRLKIKCGSYSCGQGLSSFGCKMHNKTTKSKSAEHFSSNQIMSRVELKV